MYHLHAFRHLLLAAGLGVAILASGCGGDKKDAPYPAEARASFTDSCTSSGGTPSQCACAWDKITAKYSYDEFAKIEASIADGSGSTNQLIAVVISCLGS